MAALFEVKAVDRRFYEDRLRGMLPERIIDVHAHLWRRRSRGETADQPARVASWPARVARENPAEHLQESYRLLLPDQQVTPLVFGTVPSQPDDLESGNAYVQAAAAEHHWPALIFATPQWNARELEERVLAGGFVGAKVYLTLAAPSLPENEIRIYDFLPPHQLAVLDRHGWIVMLHLPRAGRLRDPANLAQLLELEERYPNLRLIIAHVGRAYCPEDVGDAWTVLGQTRRMVFDFSANTNAEVIAQLIHAVGPKRILFGSDLPITRMRMRRICEQGNYVNLVPRGLYGDVSGDRHLREVDGSEAQALSFFLYEQLAAFRQAADSTGLTAADRGDVFHHNAARLIAAAADDRFRF